jgi:hypothetical protein
MVSTVVSTVMSSAVGEVLADGMELAVDGTAGTVTVMSDGQP